MGGTFNVAKLGQLRATGANPGSLSISDIDNIIHHAYSLVNKSFHFLPFFFFFQPFSFSFSLAAPQHMDTPG